MQQGDLTDAIATRRHGNRLAHASAAIGLQERRFTPAKLAALLAVTSEAGLDSRAVLAGTNLDLAAIADPFTLTSPHQFLTAVRNAIRLRGKPDLGVKVGSRLHASSYGMYGYALLCSEAMSRAFDVAVKYHRLANGMLDIRWIEQEGMASWLFPNHDAIPQPDVDEPMYHFLIDMQIAIHVTLIKDVMGPWCVPARAMFTQAEPAHAAALAEVLECPLAFDQPQTMLSYPAAWLSRAPQLANPITAAQMSAHCARMLEAFRLEAGITRRVFQELTRMPGRFPEIEKIAENLGMTSRTLRRKLEAEGTSYSELLTNVRKALAVDYLTTTSLSTEDIGLALGFSDAVGFRHAFKRWTGQTPNAVRRKRSFR
ncbi:AraC family transcriptional regulator [Cupriavidus necator]|uniref:AraC family transcriptional regulator n=1 Tax=Cupriavidus necator TaxID=106590 RepID=A0A367PH44_CUPNE|nr:AraC family transcriptional regulator [Cupriavidus necator]QQX86598.1 AraC family transcriptional regulator [Cupriavidus necator]RCJ06853.1 AraC family transcriptional regulator [Cupriavidus necator]